MPFNKTSISLVCGSQRCKAPSRTNKMGVVGQAGSGVLVGRGVFVGVAVAAATWVAVGGGVLVGGTAVLTTTSVGISVSTTGRVTATGSCTGKQPIKPKRQMNKRAILVHIRKKEKAGCDLLLLNFSVKLSSCSTLYRRICYQSIVIC